MNKKIYPWVIVVIVIALIIWAGFVFLVKGNEGSTATNIATTTATTNPASTVSSSPSYVSLENYYIINTQDSILVTDAQGRRAGQDPMTGMTYNEIPGSDYSDQQYTSLTIPNVMPGTYTITVGGSGPYTLEATIGQGLSTVAPQVISGTLTAGKTITYTQNYDPNNLASSTLVLQQ